MIRQKWTEFKAEVIDRDTPGVTPDPDRVADCRASFYCGFMAAAIAARAVRGAAEARRFDEMVDREWFAYKKHLDAQAEREQG